MTKYVLDTDTCIYWLNGDRHIEKKILEASFPNVYMTVITECELYYGAYKSSKTEKNLDLLKLLCRKISTIQTTPDVAPLYGKIKNHLEKSGQMLDDADLLIGCITMAGNRVLVTNNTRHFSRIPGLRWENWRKAG